MSECDGKKKLSLGDLILSALPWPFHKDLPTNYCGKDMKATFWDLVLFALPWPLRRDLPKKDGES